MISRTSAGDIEKVTLCIVNFTQVITDDHKRRRRNARNAIALTEMRGGTVSPFARELLQRYQDGEIYAAEMRAIMNEHIKRPSVPQDRVDEQGDDGGEDSVEDGMD